MTKGLIILIDRGAPRRLHPWLAFMLVLVLGLSSPVGVKADGVWLDGAVDQWNTPGMAVPAPPPRSPFEPFATDDPLRCSQSDRPLQTPEDAAVAAAGWTLFGTYQGGWGIVVVAGLTGHDGMCRPLGYQYFVFVDGMFAGTTSPLPMDSRIDGSAGPPTFTAPGDTLQTHFARYADTDPLCCPSRISDASYSVERTTAGPVVRLTSASTRSSGGPESR